MEKVRYMISDAANIVNVESHVLRYWEDELALNIPRNEMGHRYYTKENIQEFQKIKELKEQGYQLKAIRMIVHNGPMDGLLADEAIESNGQTAIQVQESRQSVLDNTDKMAQFTDLMTEIVGKAIEANNQALSQNISEEVGKQVIKEMNYLMREREEMEEDRFRKLDAAIRGSIKKKEESKRLWKKKKPSQP